MNFNLIKNLLYMLIILSAGIVKAQKPGDFIVAMFDDNETKAYYARIDDVNGNIIECTFLHSKSKYVLDLQKNDSYFNGKVVSNVGGSYKKGSKLIALIFADASVEGNCEDEDYYILTFSDGNKFLAEKSNSSTGDKYVITHSRNYYIVSGDEGNYKILSTNGNYKKKDDLKKISCTKAI